MEIFSIGQKIRRARIYRKLTLKDLCEDKISVSKMSCIENDRIKPEGWVIEFLSNKLKININYLKQQTKEEIINNINIIISNVNGIDYEDKLKYNLKFSEKYLYYDLCLKIIHLIFDYYLKNNKLDAAQSIIFKYHDYMQKCFSENNISIYYMDIANLLFKNKEYLQSANYYNNVIAISKKIEGSHINLEAVYKRTICLIITKKYDQFDKLKNYLIKNIKYIEEDIKKAEIYHTLAILCLQNDKEKFYEYQKKEYSIYGDNLKYKAESMLSYSKILFSLKLKDKASNYLKMALNIFPEDDKINAINFKLNVLEQLLSNNILDEVKLVCDGVLDESIESKNMIFIEKAYYYKSIIFEKEGNSTQAGLYMDISLGVLLKFADKKTIYERYSYMGNMYYKLGNVSESLKYFNLAVAISKNL